MAQTAHIIGKVEYRAGDGPVAEIPEGPVEATITEVDVTLSWLEDEAHGLAAIPLGDFHRFVNEGKIKLDGPEKIES